MISKVNPKMISPDRFLSTTSLRWRIRGKVYSGGRKEGRICLHSGSKLFPLSSAKKKHILTCVILLAVFYGYSLLFPPVNKYYFKAPPGLHIIDVHVQDCKIAGLFNGPYVELAARYYDKEKYQHSFLVLDFFFPVIYSLLFASLGFAFRNRKWYWLVLSMIVAGALFDYGENFSFLYYLNHPSHWQASLVAFCTSIKSLLFAFNIVSSIILFVLGLFLTPKAPLQ